MAYKIDFADSTKEHLEGLTAYQRAIIFEPIRRELRAGKKLSLEEMEREFQLAE